MTQCEQVMGWLVNQGPITAMQAINELGIGRLAARIHDCREAGARIKTEVVQGVTRLGNKMQYAKYSLETANTEGD